MSFMKPPYEMTRDEFNYHLEKDRPDGNSAHKYTGIDSKTIKHFETLKHLSYEVPKWLFVKAKEGCKESLFKLEYGYNLYDEVQLKRKEELAVKL